MTKNQKIERFISDFFFNVSILSIQITIHKLPQLPTDIPKISVLTRVSLANFGHLHILLHHCNCKRIVDLRSDSFSEIY